MTSIVTEKAFEEAIEKHLLDQGGYIKGDPPNFDRETALDKKTLLSFLKESQPKSWEQTVKQHGKDAETKLIQRLCNELDSRGSLEVIRYGFTDYGVKYKLAFFKPVSGLNPDTEKQYSYNKLTVTRQVKYSLKNENSVDMLLSLNGIPTATIELKNPFTGQNVKDAKFQFIKDRDSRELLFQFKKRALVHFAVDPDEVFMTTKLEGNTTRYLPFNLGNNNGKGNPPNPKGHRTSYLWEKIWAKDIWMDILSRFLHYQVEEIEIDGKTFKKESLLFPRYHQLDVVRKLANDARENGPGNNYLIQHSAGSGKSNSIAWIAYRLSSLHSKDDKRVFDSVIVVTDRLVLDKQLQDTIFQFEHTQGVVQKVDKDSTQLANALSTGTNIIITTLQKFPFVLDKISSLPSRSYAVIVDEAHSSQGGESAKKMKEVLSAKDLEDAEKEDDGEEYDDSEDMVRKSMESRGPHSNLSFFAFTATPKSKTLEVFGTRSAIDGTPYPFHLYSMRQAIEEGFIKDVLENYTTYKTYYKLAKAIEDDPTLNKKKATKAIARFVSIHPHNIAQKTEVMIEHFRQITMKKIGGKAKAMVVTPSRLHVVRYKQEFDRYIKEKGYKNIKALVAFSGTVETAGIKYTEPDMNGFGEKELPRKFNTPEYQILLVAEKYQTGFDQPLLHTMFVDKVLSGLHAVQTLSRLNRIYPGKEDTFILDFVNNREDIFRAFQPYYEITTTENTDPNLLYDLKGKIEGYKVIWQSEIEAFCKAFFQSKHTNKENAELNAYVDPAVDRYNDIEKDADKDEFKHLLLSFLRLYSFLSQIITFQDIELEMFYTYIRFLLKKLPKRDVADILKLDDDVAMEYYRLEKISSGCIPLEKGEVGILQPASDIGTGKANDEKAPLSEIVNILNEKFGTDFDDADRLFFKQIEEELVAQDTLTVQARNNSIDNFKYAFEDAFNNTLFKRMEQNQEIFKRIIDDKKFGDIVKSTLLEIVYSRLNKDAA